MADIGRTPTITTLGELPKSVDQVPGLREWLENLAAAVDIREGRVGKGTNTRFVTIQDLVTAGVVPDGKIV